MVRVQKNRHRSDCPINFAVEILGDKWSLLILRDMMYEGKKTHGEFLRSAEGIATNILADRLLWLERENIIQKAPDPNDKRKELYTLTEGGFELIPVLIDLALWAKECGPSYIQDLDNEAFFQALKHNRAATLAGIADEIKRGGSIFSFEKNLRSESSAAQ